MANWTATQYDYEGPDAPVYVIQGCSGNRESESGFPADPPAWSAGHSSTIGYGLMLINRNSIDFTYYAANATSGPVALDHFTITK